MSDDSVHEGKLYCIDTSAILDGWRRYYPRDTFPGLWENLESLIADGELIAPDEVLHELKFKDDDVYSWAKGTPDLFVPICEEIQAAAKEILRKFPRLVNTQKGRDRADPFVVAVAKVRNGIVVTGEKNYGVPERPRIPIVCDHYGIMYIDLLTLVQRKSWTFH